LKIRSFGVRGMNISKTLLTIPAALALWVCFSVPAKADYYDDALLTYQHGEYLDAFVMFEKLATQGDPRAQFWIGTMWYEGKGKPQNYREAYRWYLRSAYLGNANSQNNLGLIYEKGQIQPANPVVAYAWFSLAAAHNDDETNTVAHDNLNRLTDSLKAEHENEIIEGQALAQEYAARINTEKQAQRKIDLAAVSAPRLPPTPSPGVAEAGRHPVTLTPVLRRGFGEIYKVQIGLFGQAQNIKGMRADLAKKGYRFEDKMIDVQGNSYHRFRIGPYTSLQSAQAAKQKVDRLFKLQSAVIPLLR